MGIVYLLTSLMLIISFIILKKSEEKQNVLFWTFITIVSKMCLNVFISSALTVVHIKSTLLILSIVYLILSGLILFRIIKKKEIQKYYIKIKDIIVLVLLLVFVILIANKQFGFPFELKYETTDPAVHYHFAKTFYDDPSTPAGDLATNMPGAYVNTGILFTAFSNWIDEIELYNVYILFDIIVLYLIGAMFYIGIVDKIDSVSKSIITALITVIFICGYPLNSMLFGFSYLSVGILIMAAIISFMKYYKSKELKDWITMLVMFLINFGLFFSYYFFVPIMYASIGIYMLIDMLKNRKKKNIFSIFTIKNIVYVFVVLGLPTIFGLLYFILPPWLSPTLKLSVTHIGSEGFCYRNLFSNFLLFLPFVVFYTIHRIKNKENSFSVLTNIITIIFTVLLYILATNNKVSTYYYYKTYFLMGMLVPLITAKSMFVLFDKKAQVYGYAAIITYIAVVVAAICQLDTTIYDINSNLNPIRKLGSYSDLYTYNYKVMDENEAIYTHEQIAAIKYVKEHGIEKENIRVQGGILKRLWANNIASITETSNMKELQTTVELDINKWLNDDDIEYYLIFDNNENIDKNSSRYSIEYEDEGVVLLKK